MMNRLQVLLTACTASFMLVAGCGQNGGSGVRPNTSQDPPLGTHESKAVESEIHDHHGIGPNGGVVFDLGKYHAEFLVDHAKTECAVLFLDGEGAKSAPFAVAASELTLTTLETMVKEGMNKGKQVPAMTILLKAVEPKEGKASRFVGSDPGVGFIADFAGTVSGLIDGKPSSGQFRE